MLADADRKDPDTDESLASASYLEVVKKFGFGTWRSLEPEELRAVVTEYLEYEASLWIIINFVYGLIAFGIYAFGVQPGVKWFCANYHPLGYTISAFADYDICTLPEYWTYG